MSLQHELGALSERILHTSLTYRLLAWAILRIGVRFDLFFKAVANYSAQMCGCVSKCIRKASRNYSVRLRGKSHWEAMLVVG